MTKHRIQSFITFLIALAITCFVTGCDREGRASSSLYWGKPPAPEKLAELKRLGVKSIINLRMRHANETRKLAESMGLKYFHIPTSLFRQPPARQMREFIEIVADPSNRPVYVYCMGGRDRTTYYIALYRIAFENWSIDLAKKEMRAHELRKVWPVFWFYDDTLKKNEKEIHALVKSLGAEVNETSYAESCPCFTFDGKPLWLSRVKHLQHASQPLPKLSGSEAMSQ